MIFSAKPDSAIRIPFLIAAFEFFHRGIHATERIVQNNNEKIWRILQGRGSPTAMYVDKGRTDSD